MWIFSFSVQNLHINVPLCGYLLPVYPNKILPFHHEDNFPSVYPFNKKLTFNNDDISFSLPKKQIYNNDMLTFPL